nr:hypothetical protein [Tanacetum cinerariifolium]
QWAYLSTHPSKRLHSFCFDDDDEDYTAAITPDEPVLSTEEPDHSLSMGDEHLDTIPATESNEFIKSSVETLIPIPSESEGIPEHVCDVPSHDNSPPLDVSKDQFEDISPSLTKNFLRLMMIHSLLTTSTIGDGDFYPGALNTNPTPSSDCKTKSPSISLNSLLEETNTFDNSLLEFETFCFDVEEISSGNTTTHPDISLLEYEAFHDDHVKEISSGIAPYYLLSLRTEDIIFDPGICKSTFSRPDISHRCGTVKKFNTHCSHLNTCPMMIHGQNNPLLDVLLFHFYPP